MNAIETKNLTKKYGAVTAVNNLNLTVKEGELFALLGVNGAGKTTTVRMLSCLSTPTEGEATVGGFSVKEAPDKVKSIIGISTQDTAVSGKLTVRENLCFAAGIYGYEGAAKEKRILDMTEAFQLSEVLDTKAGKLSGGWQRKLSIAMALIVEPKVLFLDEPTLGLDVLARRELWKVIEKLKGNTTIVLTTHYMEEAEALSDRIGVMIGGSLVAVGTLAELEDLTGKKGLENVFIAIAERGE